MKHLRKILVLFVVVLISHATADWHFGGVEHHWYGVTIDGVRAGWAEESVATNDTRIQSQKIQEMTLSRGGMEISIKVSSNFIETKDGKPISIHTTQEAMGQVQESTWKFNDSMIEMTTVAGGTPSVKLIPLPKEPWLTPQAVKRLFKKKMNEGAAVITYQTMAPEIGPSVITVVMTKKGEALRTVLGEELLVSTWETVNDKLPLVGTESYTKSGLHVASSIDAGFGAITNTIMRMDEARAPIIEVPELMVSLFVEPNKKIDNSQQKLKMNIASKDGTTVTLPSVGFQHASSNENGSATIVLDLTNAISSTEEENRDVNYITPTAICDSSDIAIINLTHDALLKLPDNSTKYEHALALRNKVHLHITKKNMSKAFGSASQTARSKEGDCTEHAVLLCGVLRAADIPSRGVMGLVYIPNAVKPNGVFGWHMWSQALIDGKWVDLDATLTVPFTVGHIATATTSLSDDSMATEMASILSSIGNLEVEVVEVDEQ